MTEHLAITPAALPARPRGYILALSSAAIQSTSAVFIRYLTETYHLPALVLAFWRGLITCLCLLLILAIFRPALLHTSRENRGPLIGYGFILAVFNALFTLSVALNGAAVSNVLVYSSAGFTALLGWWLLKERLSWVKILAVAICLSGCIFVANAWDPGAWQSNAIAILTGILSGLAYAGYSLAGRAISQRGINPWTAVVYSFGTAAVLLLLVNLAPGGILPGAAARPGELIWLGKAWIGWLILAALAVGPTLTGFGAYNMSLGHLPSSTANLVATTEPVFTALIAYFLLAERLTAGQLAGSGLILGGVVFLGLFEHKI